MVLCCHTGEISPKFHEQKGTESMFTPYTGKQSMSQTVNSVAIDEAPITQKSLSNQAASTLQIYHFNSAPKD